MPEDVMIEILMLSRSLNPNHRDAYLTYLKALLRLRLLLQEISDDQKE